MPLSKTVLVIITILNIYVEANDHYKFDSDEEIQSSFEKMIEANQIVIFCASDGCKKVEDVFNNLDEEYKKIDRLTFDITKYPEKSDQMQKVLEMKTEKKAEQHVFIRKQAVGDFSDVKKALADFTLYDILDGTFTTYQYDYVVIGGGSGGLASAKVASSYGRKVAVCDFVEKSPTRGTTWGIGGTCVNVGCIPKKLMHRAAIIREDIGDATYFGWNPKEKKPSRFRSFMEWRRGVTKIEKIFETEHSWSKMVTNVQRYIKKTNWKTRNELISKKITVYNKRAVFKDKHTLELYDVEGNLKKTITSQNFLLAMGNRPKYPRFLGWELCISSDDIFSLEEPPGKTLIIGGSYIALETAGFLRGLGYDVTIMVRSVLLREFDQDMAKKIGAHLENKGVKFLWNYTPESVTDLGNGLLLVKGRSTKEQPDTEDTYKTVFLAIGREPATVNMGLENLNIEFQVEAIGGKETQSRRINVNKYSQTNIRNIFAVGDIIEKRLQLTPVAIQQGKLLAERLYGGKEIFFNEISVPTTVFTPFEYGCVGYTEDEAIQNAKEDFIQKFIQEAKEKAIQKVKEDTAKKSKEEDLKNAIEEAVQKAVEEAKRKAKEDASVFLQMAKDDIEVYHTFFTPLEWQVPNRNIGECYAKLISKKSEREKVMGLHYLGPNAGEVIQGYAIALKLGATKADFDDLIGIHPTNAEVFTTITKELVEESSC